MNGFDRQALAWIAFLNKKFIPDEARGEIERLGLDVEEGIAEDQSKRDFVSKLLWPRSINYSEKTVEATRAYVGALIKACPSRFAYHELTMRSRRWGAIAGAHFFVVVYAVNKLPDPSGWYPSVFLTALILFTPAFVGWSMLWKTKRLIRRLKLTEELKKNPAE